MEAEWVGKWGCQGVGDGVGNANGDGGWGFARGLAQCSIARQSQWDHIYMFRSLSFPAYMYY